MITNTLLDKRALVARWGVSRRTIDRLRFSGRLPWIDLSVSGRRPAVRFKLSDVERYEATMMRGGDPEPIGQILDRITASPDTLQDLAKSGR